MAAEIAVAMCTFFNVDLYYCFEKNGVLKEVWDDNSVIENINTQTYQALIADGHPRANQIYQDWNQVNMNAFPNLSDEDIEAILEYVEGLYYAYNQVIE